MLFCFPLVESVFGHVFEEVGGPHVVKLFARRTISALYWTDGVARTSTRQATQLRNYLTALISHWRTATHLISKFVVQIEIFKLFFNQGIFSVLF